MPREPRKDDFKPSALSPHLVRSDFEGGRSFDLLRLALRLEAQHQGSDGRTCVRARVVRVWYKGGTRKVEVWYKYGRRMVQVWYTYGTRMVQGWHT